MPTSPEHERTQDDLDNWEEWGDLVFDGTPNGRYAVVILTTAMKRLEIVAVDAEGKTTYVEDLLTERNRARLAELKAAIARLEETAAPPCPKCEGCGQIANSDDGEPWSFWERLPEASNLAVRLGIVRPIPCPLCAADP